MNNPILNPAILLAPVENGYIAYDPATDQLHELNALAALIAELCDGSRGVEQLLELVAALLPDDGAKQICQWIGDALNAGLLTFEGQPIAEQRELSATELTVLAERLQANGSVEAAFLCQMRATELAPDTSENWLLLGELAHITGRRDEARVAYEKHMESFADDAEIGHLLVALRDEEPPPRVSNECIVQLYSRFSSFFEDNLCNDLDYRGPERLEFLLQSVIENRRHLKVLDLGCGTGLAGSRFKHRAALMFGIDLSPEMIALARQRDIYDHLEVTEITDWLDRSCELFDLIVAADSLIYFGDLGHMVAAAMKRLTGKGVFAFTLERGNQYPFKLTDSGRYSHHPGYVRDVCNQAGLPIAHLEEEYLRMEYGQEVTGLFVVVQTPP